MTWRLLGVLLTLGALSACGDDATKAADSETHAEAAGDEHWSHDDPGAWGGTCATGREQSPVDLTGARGEDLADIEFDYGPSPVTVANTGHTIQAEYAEGGSIEVDGTTYDLVQFHFHAPSEHTVDGRHAAAELHLVHQDADGHLAVVGVLVEEGPASDAVAPVLADAPAEEGEETEPSAEVDAAGLLPDSPRTFRYDGSLTTPPCTEGVKWMVMSEPVTWSGEQLAAFTGLYGGSNRPVQPLGDRVEVVDTTD